MAQIMGIKSTHIDSEISDADGPAGTAGAQFKMARLKLTDEEKKKLQDMIKKADSLHEIIRLEKMLNEGRVPTGIYAGDKMEE